MLETDGSPPTAEPAEVANSGPVRLRQRGSNHVGLRQFNERVVLQALRTHGSLAKAEMARVTGLTAQTIGLITARLDEDQLLRREAPVRGRVGQPSVPIGLKPTFLLVKVARVICFQCELTRQVKVPFADPRRTYTHAFERFTSKNAVSASNQASGCDSICARRSPDAAA